MGSRGSICTIEGLAVHLAAPLDAVTPSETITQAAEEARELTDAAFGRADPVAMALAERLLYSIHVHTHFSVPVQAVPAVVWSVLMTAKLRSCLAGYDVPPVDADEMGTMLTEAVELADRRDHTLVQDVCAEDGLDGLRLYTKNWYGSTHGFTHQLTALAQRCDGVIKKEIMENLADEFQDTPHPEIRARWPKRIGLDYSPDGAMDDPDILTTAFGLQNFRTGVCNLSDPTYALGMFYSVEAIFPPLCSHMVSALRKRGFEEETFEIFTLHAEVDVEHSAEFLAGLQEQPFTDEERARVVTGAKAQLDVRGRMFDGLKERHARTTTSPHLT